MMLETGPSRASRGSGGMFRSKVDVVVWSLVFNGPGTLYASSILHLIHLILLPLVIPPFECSAQSSKTHFIFTDNHAFVKRDLT